MANKQEVDNTMADHVLYQWGRSLSKGNNLRHLGYPAKSVTEKINTGGRQTASGDGFEDDQLIGAIDEGLKKLNPVKQLIAKLYYSKNMPIRTVCTTAGVSYAVASSALMMVRGVAIAVC